MRLKDKVVIITGAAQGIGKAAGEMFLNEGARVIFCDIDIDTISEYVDKKQAEGFDCLAMYLNVCEKECVADVLEHIKEKYCRIDCLINNAGITQDNTLSKMTDDEWNRVIDVNLKGVFNCGQEVSRIMAEQKFGCIINVSSIVGIYGNYGQTNYAASKWGVIGMTKTWAKELGKFNIRVNAVAPGFIMTPMTDKMPDKVLEKMKDKSPLGILGNVKDIAYGMLYLASDESKYVTGTVLNIDGGTVL